VALRILTDPPAKGGVPSVGSSFTSNPDQTRLGSSWESRLKAENTDIGREYIGKISYSALVDLAYPTDDGLMTKAATESVNNLFRTGYKHSSAVVSRMGLRQPGEFTDDLFAHSQPVMEDESIGVLDEINGPWGKGVLQVASVPASPS